MKRARAWPCGRKSLRASSFIALYPPKKPLMKPTSMALTRLDTATNARNINHNFFLALWSLWNGTDIITFTNYHRWVFKRPDSIICSNPFENAFTRQLDTELTSFSRIVALGAGDFFFFFYRVLSKHSRVWGESSHDILTASMWIEVDKHCLIDLSFRWFQQAFSAS